MARTELAVAELLWNLASGKTGNTGRVSFFPQKPVFPSENTGTCLERATPESQGIESAHLREFLV